MVFQRVSPALTKKSWTFTFNGQEPWQKFKTFLINHIIPTRINATLIPKSCLPIPTIIYLIHWQTKVLTTCTCAIWWWLGSDVFLLGYHTHKVLDSNSLGLESSFWTDISNLKLSTVKVSVIVFCIFDGFKQKCIREWEWNSFLHVRLKPCRVFAVW